MSDVIPFPAACRRQIMGAYRRMARVARYRPEAPGDGLGNIAFPLEELDLEAEADAYAETWWREEDDDTFVVGCCNFETRPATIYALEAARCLCGVADDVALRLLQMAVADLTARKEAGR